MKSIVYENVVPLAGNASFTTGIRSMLDSANDFGSAVVNYTVVVDSDQAGTVEVDESTDEIVWIQVQAPTVYPAASGQLVVSVTPTETFVRSKFTNGATPQTRFTMSTGVDY